MVELKKIRDLVQLMVENNLTELSLRDGAEEVNLKRPGPADAMAAGVSAGVPGLVQSVGQQPNMSATGETGASTAGVPLVGLPGGAVAGASSTDKDEDDDLVPIRSPMVGTFYMSATPDNPPYVEVGTRIAPGTVVCMVEAMKVFNEIKAEVAGVIERILTGNEQAVEFGQELFLVRPA